MSFLRKVNEVTRVEEHFSAIATAEPVTKPAPTVAAKPSPNREPEGSFLSPQAVEDLRKRWDVVQTNFVDEPRDSVKQADELVASAINRLVESFSEARTVLEEHWTDGDEVETEDLRVALRKYRSLFQKLMSM